MSEKGPEPDIKPRRVNVAEVPQTDNQPSPTDGLMRWTLYGSTT
jgi:hypothetical protein